MHCIAGCSLVCQCPLAPAPALIPAVLQGEYCRIWDGSHPLILQPNDKPYVFHSAVCRPASMELDGYPAFISQSENVISHGIHHIITVPSGQVCLVWHDGEARILGLESVLVSTVPPPGGSFSTGPASSAAPSTASSTASAARGSGSGYVPVPAAASGGAGSSASSVRRYVIESPNFRLASVAQDGYDAWVAQVRIAPFPGVPRCCPPPAHHGFGCLRCVFFAVRQNHLPWVGVNSGCRRR